MSQIALSRPTHGGRQLIQSVQLQSVQAARPVRTPREYPVQVPAAFQTKAERQAKMLASVAVAPAAASPVQQAHQAAPARIKLTPRGRFVLLVLPALMLLTLLVMVIGAALQPANATTAHVTGPGTGLTEVTVSEGDTLWSLAKSFAPSRDARDVVHDISELNSLGAVLRPGDTLVVPFDE